MLEKEFESILYEVNKYYPDSGRINFDEKDLIIEFYDLKYPIKLCEFYLTPNNHCIKGYNNCLILNNNKDDCLNNFRLKLLYRSFDE